MNYPRLFRTVRHLLPSQVLWRARYFLGRRWESSAVGRYAQRLAARYPTALEAASWSIEVPRFHEPEIPAEQRAGELEENRLTLLGMTLPFAGGGDWRAQASQTEHRLWTHTLHYHGWLRELAEAHAATGEPRYGALVARLLRDWLDTCRPGQPGFDAHPWNSYAIACRLASWSLLFHDLGAEFWSRNRQLEHDFLRSMAQQAQHLEEHIEWDLRGNHLMRDACGLAWAGRFFNGPDAARWRRKAARIADEQAQEQVLADGSHFERSPMYHLHFMEEVLTLVLLLDAGPARKRLRETWQRMAEAAAWLRHPDGEIPLFNDASLHLACPPAHMLSLGRTIGVAVDPAPRRGGIFLGDLGMAIWHGEPWSIFLDVGPVGPDYQPGHAHADSLSLEASYRGQRMFVDPGLFCYDNDAQRRYDRSTLAHNTVCIDGSDSSEVWHIFRVGRRAYPVDVRVRLGAMGLFASAAHTGYHHLPGRPRHTRSLEVGAELAIVDRIEGGGRHVAVGGFLLHPAWKVEADAQGWQLQCAEEIVSLRITGPTTLQRFQESRPYHPRFGRETLTTRLCWKLEGELPLEVRTIVHT